MCYLRWLQNQEHFFLISLRKYDQIKFFFLKNETNNLHLKNINNGTFYRNTVIQGGKKIRKAEWNVIAQINCVDKFNETNKVFIQNSWENRTERDRSYTCEQLRALSQKRGMIPTKQQIKTVWKIFEI